MRHLMDASLKHRLVRLVMLIATVTFVFSHPATAQATRFWSTDGCLYQRSGNQTMRVECRHYSRALGAWVARNAQGAFVAVDGRWMAAQEYELLAVLRQLAAATQQQGSIVFNGDGTIAITQPAINVTPGSPDPCLTSYNQLAPRLKAFCQAYWTTLNQINQTWVQPNPYLYVRYF